MRPSVISLPLVRQEGVVSVDSAIERRRSIRSFRESPLGLEDVSRLRWSAQGKREGRYQTVPSASATYPLGIAVVVGRQGVRNLSEGVYHYDPEQTA